MPVFGVVAGAAALVVVAVVVGPRLDARTVILGLSIVVLIGQAWLGLRQLASR